jgi:primase-polymerase (primpol)-like protein
MPVTAETQESASTTDPETWTTFEIAEAVGTADNVEETDGIGFVFSEEDPFVGIDLDDCVVDGKLKDWATKLIQRFDSCTEVSPSGTGVHIIIEGDLPNGGNRNGNVEMYDSSRFFTFTGHRLNGVSTSVETRQEELEAVHAELLGSDTDITERKTSVSPRDARSATGPLARVASKHAPSSVAPVLDPLAAHAARTPIVVDILPGDEFPILEPSAALRPDP